MNPLKSGETLDEFVASLKAYSKQRWAIAYEHDQWILTAALVIEELRKDTQLLWQELQEVTAERDRAVGK
jgi:hypothetical protein